MADDFNAWFKAAKPPVMGLLATPVGSGMRLGTEAAFDIAAEEVYLSVPKALLMDQASALA